MATTTTTLRLRPVIHTQIQRLAKQQRRSFSEMAQELMDEALRTRDCPGVYFANEPAGREAKIMGTGLAVWELIQHYQDLDRNARRLLALFPALSGAQIRACLLYYAKFPTEIDAIITENRQLGTNGVAGDTA